MPKKSNIGVQKPTSNNSLPVLNQVSIETPCPMSWSEMDGTAAKRFCGHCQKHVHNFSEMNSQSVAQLIGSGESICAKIQRRPDGSVITNDTISRRGWFNRLATLAASAMAVLMLGGCKERNPEELGDVVPTSSTQTPAIMGKAVCVEELGEAMPVDEQTAQQANQNAEMMGGLAPPKPQPPQ